MGRERTTRLARGKGRPPIGRPDLCHFNSSSSPSSLLPLLPPPPLPPLFSSPSPPPLRPHSSLPPSYLRFSQRPVTPSSSLSLPLYSSGKRVSSLHSTIPSTGALDVCLPALSIYLPASPLPPTVLLSPLALLLCPP